MIKQKQT